MKSFINGCGVTVFYYCQNRSPNFYNESKQPTLVYSDNLRNYDSGLCCYKF